MNNKPLTQAIIGLVLGCVSYIIFAILSVPALILGILSLVGAAEQRKYGENATGATILGIITVIISTFALILMIINMVNISAALSSGMLLLL